MSTQPIAAAILAGLIDRLGQRNWLRFAESDRVVIEACCFDAAELQLSLLAAGSDSPLQQRLLLEKAQVSAQLANVAAAHQLAIESTIWEVTSALLVRVGTALVKG